MTTINQFKECKDKTAFLLENFLDEQFYEELGKLDKETRQELAIEILASDNYQRIIIKLADLCFRKNGSEFIRKGSSDFLADVLCELLRRNESKEKTETFAYILEHNSEVLPQNYEFSEAFKNILAIIQDIAQRFAKSRADLSYINHLASNIFIKVFGRLVIDSLAPIDSSNPSQYQKQFFLPGKLQQFSKQPEMLQQYFNEKLQDTTPDTELIAEIYSELQEQKEVAHLNAITTIKSLILNNHWEVAGIGFLKGGVNLVLEGKTLKVPHRVAEIANLVEGFEQLEDPNAEDLFQLYRSLQTKAKEALDQPRRGQKESTREFYRALLNNSYLLTTSAVEAFELASDNTPLL
ncbi:hypothetical protein [Legionella jordanis]|uniref:Uncharacterized protein n=1 Tax=Legionella jordanis TaxID=456 RepID=A0A0W0VBR1_9GAMM|nr:hypothetical protein [Legionella jordanis]KTD17570.1 hypothetical protein Ljor_1876 [Legionella jordanis]RMX05094.1 hypothetical protein EAW55_00045 [Legionella jordanis]RMX17350.1 hypothetical protein EAS68_10675 [Legionella jordanis]VEH13539.1 Uncharacterised protein [Legionella jordanis]HAT8714455.1 hypothetical protein [Legionella jordanis]